MRVPSIKSSFLRYFLEELPITLFFCQMLGITAALVLMMYGEAGSSGDTIAISIIFANSFGLFTKLTGALFYARYFPNHSHRRLIHVILWIPAIFIGTVIGSEFTFIISRWIFWARFPNPFSGEHLTMLGANLVMVYTFSLMAFIYITARRRLRRNILETERIRRLQAQTQFSALQAKINPHFLFNTLNTMLNLVHKEPEKLESMILNLSDIYRKILQYPEDKMIDLEEEVKLLQKYLEIEKIRMGDRLAFQIDIEPGLEDFPIPPLLIEPVVENAIIHGISPKAEGGEIDIRAESLEKMIRITVSDDGIGIGDSDPEAGFGLYSVRERLQLKYKDRASFKIMGLPGGGTEVRMEIPRED
jgi:sensor histidine kinase YesM